MTINLGLVISEAVVLGCDSIASTTGYYLDPIALDWEVDADGVFTKDGDGKFRLKFDFSDYQSIVTNAWGGVTKMFQIYPDPSPMVAVTAGLAKMKDRPIASWGSEFLRVNSRKNKKKLTDCEEICKTFLTFMRSKYDEHHANSHLPESLREGPEFLIGGFGRDDDFASVFRVLVKENLIVKQLGVGGSVGPTGVAWNGQSDGVERFLRGYDNAVKRSVERRIVRKLKAHATNVQRYVADTLNSVLDRLGATMPDGMEIHLPELEGISLNWDQYPADIDYANLPLQEAINFVAFLVLLQDGKGRFVRGVATVGGRTHIGIVTKDKGFRLLNEAELTHKHTGFGDDQ